MLDVLRILKNEPLDSDWSAGLIEESQEPLGSSARPGYYLSSFGDAFRHYLAGEGPSTFEERELFSLYREAFPLTYQDGQPKIGIGRAARCLSLAQYYEGIGAPHKAALAATFAYRQIQNETQLEPGAIPVGAAAETPRAIKPMVIALLERTLDIDLREYEAAWEEKQEAKESVSLSPSARGTPFPQTVSHPDSLLSTPLRSRVLYPRSEDLSQGKVLDQLFIFLEQAAAAEAAARAEVENISKKANEIFNEITRIRTLARQNLIEQINIKDTAERFQNKK